MSLSSVLSAAAIPPSDPSAWRKLPDWSASFHTTSAVSSAFAATQLNRAQGLATLAASKGLERIRATAADKIAKQQAAAQEKLAQTVTASKATSVSPRFGFAPSATGNSTAVGPRFSFLA